MVDSRENLRNRTMTGMEYAIAIPFWNRKSLEPPNSSPLKLFTNGRNVVLSRKISSLRSLLCGILVRLNKMEILNKEAAILSRMVYRMKRVFRQDKGFKFIQMLLKALKNHLSLNLSQLVTTLRDACFENYCPTKQMIEWSLVTLLRFSALFHRIHCLSEQGASIIKERFSSGHQWKQAALCIGIISRVWALADFFVVKSCEWYLNLKEYLSVAVATEEQWLPADFSLPADISSWLGRPAYLTSPLSEAKDDSDLNHEKPSGKSKTENKPDSKTVVKSLKSPIPDLPISTAMELDEDVGEAISRDSELPEKALKRKTQSKDVVTTKKKRKKVST